MGRRALPKINPDLDLSDHYCELAQLPQPWDERAIFGREAPLEIEVGTGKGLFLAAAASQLPKHNFLGIEVSGKYSRFTASRLAQSKLPNARAVHGDGLQLFREMLPANRLRAVHVYFPDPWWKRRHRRRRLLNDQFLSDVTRTLQPGGRFHFWTDVQEYFDVTLERIALQTLLTGPLAEKPLSPDDSSGYVLDYRTHFERRTRMQGAPVYRSEFVKQG